MLLSSSPTATFLDDWQAYGWLVGVAFVLLLLLTVFAYVLTQQARYALPRLLGALDAALSERAPETWHAVRVRLPRASAYRLTLTAAAALCLVFIYLFAQVTEGWIDQDALYRLDVAVNERLPGLLSPQALEGVRLVTRFGGVLMASGLSIVLALVLLARRERWRVLALFLTVVAGQAVVWTLKAVFGRARPVNRLLTPEGASFPSGHTFTATVVYGFLLYLTWRWTKRPTLRLLVTPLLLLIILAVGLSRVLLRVHWFTDVVGGLTIGLAWLIFSLASTEILRAYYESRTGR